VQSWPGTLVLSEDDTEARDDEPLKEEPGPRLARTERMFLRLTLWQTVLSVVGVFIAVVALYAALTESAAVRQQTAAAVWPFVQFSTEDFDTGETAEVAIYFTNTGVGPARMRSMQLVVAGKPVSDWDAAVSQLGADASDLFRRNFVANRVLSPGEKVEAFGTSDPTLARRLLAAVERADTYITFCYCSIFDECWLTDSRRSLHDPDRVASCPDFGDAAFRN